MERAMAGSINQFSNDNGIRYREYVAEKSIVLPNFLKRSARNGNRQLRRELLVYNGVGFVRSDKGTYRQLRGLLGVQSAFENIPCTVTAQEIWVIVQAAKSFSHSFQL